MTIEERHNLSLSYLNKEVDVLIDRPIGYVHHKNAETIVYPINYGYIDGVLGGDGECLDVYILGVDYPINSFHGKIIGIINRLDDIEDKLVACPVDQSFTIEEIKSFVDFREKKYKTIIEV